MGIPAIETHQSFAALNGVMLALSVIAVALRFYSRSLQKAALKADDWVMIPAIISVAGLFILMFVDIHDHLMGYTMQKNPKKLAESAPVLSKTLIAGEFLSLAAYGFIKISALLFYHRIFCVQSRSVFKFIIWASVVVVFLWMLAFMILAAEQCGSHFSALWAPTPIRKKYCNSRYPFLEMAAASDFALDFFVLVLPIPMIWSLRMNVARKLSVMGVFLLASVGLAAAIVKLVFIVRITKAGVKDKEDVQLAETKIGFYIVLEAGISCIAVNLPTLYFLTSKVKPESVLRSVRSMLSLGSMRSQAQSQRSNGYAATGKRKESSSVRSLSVSNLVPADNVHTETHAMYDIESRGRHSLPGDDVHVTKTVSQKSERM